MLSIYESPIGRLTIDESDGVLHGLWIEGQENFPDHALGATEPVRGPVSDWLDSYFAGKNPDVSFEIEPVGTDFQLTVWSALREVPYGEQITYHELANIVEKRRGTPSSARAVGGALSKNHLMIIVPCHRIMGAGGKITGYSGGTDRKVWLLEHEAATA